MKKKPSYVWTSYSDLMTSLFFVMLVLFVISLLIVKDNSREIEKINETMAKENKQLLADKKQLGKIKELQESIKNIDTTWFEYNEKFKRHTLKNIDVAFRKGSFNMLDLDWSELDKLDAAGNSIKKFMEKAKNDTVGTEYLLIIEGQSSKDDYYFNEYRNNDVLSYKRAQNLVLFWKTRNITFDDLPCEVIVCGSGTNSKFREEEYIKGRPNEKNQRFVIHIIPKPGLIE